VLNVSQQLGGSIGLAVLGTIAASVTREELAQLRPVRGALAQALTAGFTTAFEIGTLVTLAGFVLAMLVIRVRAQSPAAEALPEAA
jgi:hypothetical protein